MRTADQMLKILQETFQLNVMMGLCFLYLVQLNNIVGMAVSLPEKYAVLQLKTEKRFCRWPENPSIALFALQCQVTHSESAEASLLLMILFLKGTT